jgi:hypothetical protein
MSQKKKKKQAAILNEGLRAVCINGPAKGHLLRVKDPRNRVIIPSPADPFYFCHIYLVTNKVTHAGEVICMFAESKRRTK